MLVQVGHLPFWRGVQDGPGFKTLPFSFCLDRGLIRQHLPVGQLEMIVDAYKENDYTFITPPPGCSAWANQLGDFYFQSLAAMAGPLIGRTVLEIGAGTLYMANRVVTELGADGYFVCDPAIQDHPASPRVAVIKEYFSARLFKERQVDLVVSLNSLEHMEDPFNHLQEIAGLLRPSGGMFFCVVPDCTRALTQGDLGVCVHEHLSYFTPESLRSVFSRCGLEVLKWWSEEDTLFAWASPAAERITELSSSSEVTLLEKFQQSLPANLNYLRELVRQLRDRGILAFHGCNIALNNYLGLLRLNNAEDILLFDGDETKAGRYLPAFARPILDSRCVDYKKAKSVIVAALTYYGPIKKFLKKHHHFNEDDIFPIAALLGDQR